MFDELWESSFQGGHCLFEWEHYVFPSCIRFPSRQKNSPTRNDNIPQERKEVQSFPTLRLSTLYFVVVRHVRRASDGRVVSKSPVIPPLQSVEERSAEGKRMHEGKK